MVLEKNRWSALVCEHADNNLRAQEFLLNDAEWACLEDLPMLDLPKWMEIISMLVGTHSSGYDFRIIQRAHKYPYQIFWSAEAPMDLPSVERKMGGI